MKVLQFHQRNLRFYLVSINPYSQDDLNFDWDDFTTRINSELIGNLGNFVNRALGFTKKAFDGTVPEIEEFDEKAVIKAIEYLLSEEIIRERDAQFEIKD